MITFVFASALKFHRSIVSHISFVIFAAPSIFFPSLNAFGDTITFTGTSILSPSVKNCGGFGSITTSFDEMNDFLVVPSLVSFVIPITSITQVVRLSGRVNDNSNLPSFVTSHHLRNAVSSRSSLIILNIALHPFHHPHLLPLFANALSDW